MSNHQIAVDLLRSLDDLIAILEGDAVLSSALLRERERLFSHLVDIEPYLALRLAENARPKAKVSRTSRFHRLRAACYGALSDGLLGSARFDSLMLLAQRALGRKAQASSSSDSPAGAGSISVGDTSGLFGVFGMLRRSSRVSRVTWPSRTKRMTASTMRACA